MSNRSHSESGPTERNRSSGQRLRATVASIATKLACNLTERTQRIVLLATLAIVVVASLGMQNALQNRQARQMVPPDSSFFSVNAKAFGAVPDDRRDDTAAIQAAIDSLPVPNHDGAKGGVVFIPRGTYNVTSLRLPPAVQLVGEGEATFL